MPLDGSTEMDHLESITFSCYKGQPDTRTPVGGGHNCGNYDYDDGDNLFIFVVVIVPVN